MPADIVVVPLEELGGERLGASRADAPLQDACTAHPTTTAMAFITVPILKTVQPHMSSLVPKFWSYP